MSLKIKKPVSVLLAAFMMLSMCSCSGGQAQGQGQEQQQSAGGYHFKWMDSALSENFDKMSKASVKDDFRRPLTMNGLRSRRKISLIRSRLSAKRAGKSFRTKGP